MYAQQHMQAVKDRGLDTRWLCQYHTNKTRVTVYPNGSLTISQLQLQDSGYHIITVTEPSGNSKDAGVQLNVTGENNNKYFVLFLYSVSH